MTADGLLTPNDVVRQLTALGRELDGAVSMLKDAEVEAVEARHAADMIESRAFLSAEGPMDIRKHRARVEADAAEEAALGAEATVRWLRQRIRAISLRIDIGRSYGAAVRAELAVLPYAQEGT